MKWFSPVWGILEFAATQAEIIELAIFNQGLMKLFQSFSVLLFFFNLFLNSTPSIRNCFGVNVNFFWHLPLGFGHISCTSGNLPFLFKWHRERLDIGEAWLFLHFEDFWIFSPFVSLVCLVWFFIYSERNCDFDVPQMLHFPFLTCTILFVLGFLFSFSIISIFLNLCLVPHRAIEFLIAIIY